MIGWLRHCVPTCTSKASLALGLPIGVNEQRAERWSKIWHSKRETSTVQFHLASLTFGENCKPRRDCVAAAICGGWGMHRSSLPAFQWAPGRLMGLRARGGKSAYLRLRHSPRSHSAVRSSAFWREIAKGQNNAEWTQDKDCANRVAHIQTLIPYFIWK